MSRKVGQLAITGEALVELLKLVSGLEGIEFASMVADPHSSLLLVNVSGEMCLEVEEGALIPRIVPSIYAARIESIKAAVMREVCDVGAG